MNLPPLTQSFVLHFGEMGSRWGINRTVGQIYALIYVSAKPLNADEIAEALNFSRSNVSMGLKELQSWNLVKLIHLPNDRREYFQSPQDVWQIFRTLATERRKREIDPTLSMLRDALMETPSGEDERVAQERMRQMHAFIELMTDWLDEVQKMDSATLASLMKMGAKVQKLLEMKDKVKQVFGMASATSDAEPPDATHAAPSQALESPASTPETSPKNEH
ncbi:GbsR/MarR family transcriptional regulator [Rhodoferax sp. AJA081-3]|uniref:GbsR/MarR family transcriptional regulator n=1 Tax=Rhodoferax sp. AJA081-3 TaxID=2752316 RepID=UPI001ADEF804|nr:GbsR/MarR family transcriptional regulator [Rhodoferax sp. AJA081-3]QTN29095.1 GbsR/MarR family transcriptional regulator [Rhodoferax sp. AJA081-3]